MMINDCMDIFYSKKIFFLKTLMKEEINFQPPTVLNPQPPVLLQETGNYTAYMALDKFCDNQGIQRDEDAVK